VSAWRAVTAARISSRLAVTSMVIDDVYPDLNASTP
jgi:hypothetical protein